ncbi:hypothetical protein BAE44_0023977 [Dichanthelium oligosanthes]|uniref:Uncharacterized protein n=1 Tax=Dichanthelium oligosanthes TaxID=888268 RepID=A0A1E5UQ66_9POAL|nr:hypothetical protein BAE44_0023977 [Dichanthelium oligosanthes]
MKEGSSGGGAAAGGNDPRQPSTAKPYAPPKLSPQDLPIDYAGFLAVVFGVVGVMLRVRSHLPATPLLNHSDLRSESDFRVYKVCSWIAIIFCAQSLANMKNYENDLKQLSMAFM